MEFTHIPILLSECISYLNPSRGGVFVDCTAGGGGHSSEIAKRLPDGGRLLCIDRDSDAIETCKKRLAPFGDKVQFVKSDYDNIEGVLDEYGIEKIDGVMWDLGVSSYQLDEAERGFSYMNDARLDMRMDKSSPLSAYEVVNGYDEKTLGDIILMYGEEKFARKIAKDIVSKRNEKPIESTSELSEIIKGAIPAASRHGEAQHPAKRTFQAIRIEVNKELDEIAPSIEGAVKRLKSGGRAAVISFHSLEDRIVKQTFAKLCKGCTCPPDFPVCTCGNVPLCRAVTKKPVVPDGKEIGENPRARSAKLRVIEKI